MSSEQGAPDEGTGLFCFRNDMRPCGPSCMAYTTTAPKGPDYLGVQWAHCMELVNMHRTGKHLAIIAELVSVEQLTRKRAAAAPGGG